MTPTPEMPEALRLANRLMDVESDHGSELACCDASAMLSEQHARIAELEAQLEAVDAGGVGPLIAKRADDPDSARLDYLQRHGATVELVAGSDPRSWRFRIGGLHESVNRDIRSAIDTAARQHQGEAS